MAMRSEDWPRIEELLNRALGLGPDARRGLLEEVGASEPELRREVESLLACEARLDGFLDATALALSADMLAAGDGEAARAGQLFGPYRILREVGRGGMGAVFLAERADGAFEQQVALKIVRRSFADADLMRRFRRERQILASLNHPHIARLLDGGLSQDGEPFLVMEYVEGVRIDDYCDEQKLSTRARLRLFLSVCQAVAYAHQHLIIHRDIKPSNVLVTSEGVPKLLDFGIAKLLDAEHADEHTRTELRAFTPEYAAPEQVAGGPVTTAADVYSLGVLLEDLLHGAHTYANARFAGGRWRSRGAQASQSRDRLRMERAEADAGAQTGEEKSKHPKLLSAELKNIIQMARREEPARRYASVQQLAEDVQRYLDGLPLRAQKDSFTYRAEKFIRRNRALVAAAALVALSLLIGTALALWQARRATEQARIAAEERKRAEERFQDVRRLANSFMFEFHDAIQDLPGSTPARALVVQRALEYLDRLARQASDDPALRRELAAAYRRLGDAQGNPAVANLGDTASALASYRKALQIRQSLPASDDAQSRREMADLLYGYGEMLWWAGDLAGADDAYRRALSIREELAAQNETDDVLRHEVALSYLGVGNVHYWNSELKLAAEENARALALLESLAAAHPQSVEYRRDVAVAYTHIGDVSYWDGKRAESWEKLRRAISILKPLTSERPLDARFKRSLMTAYMKLGTYLSLTNTTQAMDALRRALALAEEIERADPLSAQARRDVAVLYQKIGETLIENRRTQEATENLQRALSSYERLAAENPRNATAREDFANALSVYGAALQRAGDYAGAMANYRRALEQREALAAEDPNDSANSRFVAEACLRIAAVSQSLAEQARAADRAARWREARAWYERSLNEWRRLQQRGQLGGADAEALDGAARGLAHCDAALARR